MAKKKQTKEPLSQFLADLNKPGGPTGISGETFQQLVQNLSQMQSLLKTEPSATITGQGVSPAQDKELKAALEAGYSPQDIAKDVLGKSPKPAGGLPDPAKAAASVPESPYQELAQALASEYLNQINQLMPLTSGSGIFGPQGQTNQVVNEAAAMVPGGGGWLQQQAAAEQKAAAPLQGAMNQVGEAQSQGALGFAGGIANTGTANTQYLEAAPWQQILSELASETAYKAASTQGASAFGLTPQNTPAFLNQILQSHGLSGTATVGGLQPVSKAAAGGSGSTSSGLSTTTSQTG